MAKPRVSIITPLYNGERYLQATIQSVLRQSLEDWELLFINDGSQDSSVVIAREFARQHPEKIRVLEHPDRANRGQFASRVLGANEARSEVIALLDQDDLWLPEYLEAQLKLWDSVPSSDVALTFGPTLYWHMDRKSGALGDYVQPMPASPGVHSPGSLLESFFHTSYATTPCPSASLLKRSVFAEVKQYATLATGSRCEDVYLWWHAAARWPIYVHDHVWVHYRQHPHSAFAVGIANRRRAAMDEMNLLIRMGADLASTHPGHPLLTDQHIASRLRRLRCICVALYLRDRLSFIALFNSLKRAVPKFRC